MSNRIAVLVIAIYRCAFLVQGTDIGDAFSLFSYRTQPVVGYITRTKAWAEGRRDILDWGCGGGALSRALAEKGAGKLVAVDMSQKATETAQRNLEPFPNAIARGPRYASSVPGLVAFRSEFDTVVSFMGALTEGTTIAERIAPHSALQRAVMACREGGSVVIAELEKKFVTPYLSAAILLLVGAFAMNNASWVQSLNEWQLLLFSFLASIGSGALNSIILTFAVRNVARSSMYKMLRISTVVYCTLYIMDSIGKFKSDWEILAKRRAAMESAGLTNVKRTSRLLYRIVEPNKSKDADATKLVTLLLNFMLSPAKLNIYEGVKKTKKER